jgi:hypothetical protein
VNNLNHISIDSSSEISKKKKIPDHASQAHWGDQKENKAAHRFLVRLVVVPVEFHSMTKRQQIVELNSQIITR